MVYRCARLQRSFKRQTGDLKGVVQLCQGFSPTHDTEVCYDVDWGLMANAREPPDLRLVRGRRVDACGC
jgi:hypothetical protein